MLFGPDHVGDREVVVVHQARDVMEARAVGSLVHVVLLPLPGELHPAADGFVDHNRPFPGHLEPDRARAALDLERGRGRVIEGGEPPAVEEKLPRGLGGLAFLVELIGRREVAIRYT
jgi:hypothetical protein